jgi:hypothetical protein
MDLLETYLDFIQEKEWDETPGNEDAFDQKVYSKVLGGPVSSTEPLNDVRHDLDTNYFDIYMKDMLGDYKGRVDSFNVSADRMPFGKDVEKKLAAIKANYSKIRSRYDNTDNSRFKAKPRKRSPDDDFEVRDDNANIGYDSNDDGVIDGPSPAMGGDGAGGDGGAGAGGGA